MLSVKLDNLERKSAFKNIKLNEMPNDELLEKLIRSDLLKQTFNNKYAGKTYENELKQLLSYRLLKNHKTGLYEINYLKDGSGRCAPYKSLAAISIRRQIRHTLFKDNYIDIDVENCHPVILSNILETNNKEHPCLQEYIKNRKYYLDEIMKHFNCDKDTSKNVFIRLLNLGKLDNWIKDNNFNISNIKTLPIYKFLKDFQREMIDIVDYIKEENEDLYQELEHNNSFDNKHNKDGTFISIYLQEQENRVLEVIYKWMVNNKFIDNRKICSLCHDGIMILKPKKELQHINILEELNIEVLKNLGFNLKFTIKDMNEDYINIIDNHILDDEIIKSRLKNKEILTYDNIKFEFEKHTFKIMHPPQYLTITNDKIISYKSKDLNEQYQNKYYYFETEEEDDEGNKIKSYEKLPFLKEWLKDENILTYDKTDFNPSLDYKENKDPNVFNTFTGYAIEKIKVNKNIDIKIEDTLIYKHFINLCGGEEEENINKCVEYFIKCLSNIIQQKYKSTSSIILNSRQGCGKDLFIDWFSSIIGTQYYVNTAAQEKLFGNFNSLLEDKLLCVLNEAQTNKPDNNIIDLLKDLITNKTIVIEKKGIDSFVQKNRIFYFFFSNRSNPVSIENDDRRFFILECNDKVKTIKNYFENLMEEMKNDDIKYAFYEYFKNLDLSDWDQRDIPFTNKKKMNILMNLSPLDNFINEYLDNNISNKGKKNNVLSSVFYEKYIEYLEKNGYKHHPNKTRFGLDLKIYKSIEKVKNKNLEYEIDISALIDEQIKRRVYEPPRENNIKKEDTKIINYDDDHDDDEY